VRAFDARTGALRWSWDPIPWASQTTPRTGLAMPGRRSRWTPSAGSSSSRPAAPAPITSAAPARRQPVGQLRRGLARRYRRARLGIQACTTISGTTTSPLSRRCSRGRTERRPSPSRPRWDASSSSTGGPVSRCCPSRSARCRRATCRRARGTHAAVLRLLRRARALRRRRCVGRHAGGRRLVSGEDRRLPRGGDLHAAEPARHDRLPGIRRRRELGQWEPTTPSATCSS
jgi:hypothetical protein